MPIGNELTSAIVCIERMPVPGPIPHQQRAIDHGIEKWLELGKKAMAYKLVPLLARGGH